MFSTHSFDFFVEKTLKRVCTQLIVSKILTCYDKNENGRLLFIFSQGGTDHATVEKVYVGGPILGLSPQAEKARAALAKDQAVKTVVKHAAVGGIVAGPAGAVVGAIVGKAKNDAK